MVGADGVGASSPMAPTPELQDGVGEALQTSLLDDGPSAESSEAKRRRVDSPVP